MTDYKQLCAELLEWAERTSSHYYKQADVIIRARAALAEPEPEEPTRRSKPPSLKEQALGALYAIATGADDTREFCQDLKTIKQALESLPS
jgi:hypothetical protein